MEQEARLLVQFLVLHHSASDKEICCDDIRKWHLQRGWDDIGYHWLVNDKGEISPGRPENIAGAHALGLNFQSLGICCIGNYQSECPSELMMKSLIDILANLCLKYKLTSETIIGHRDARKISSDATQTECPGEALANLLPAIREAVRKRLELAERG